MKTLAYEKEVLEFGSKIAKLISNSFLSRANAYGFGFHMNHKEVINASGHKFG